MPLVASLVWDLPFERKKMPNKAYLLCVCCFTWCTLHLHMNFTFGNYMFYFLSQPRAPLWLDSILFGMELRDVEMLPLLPSASQAGVPMAQVCLGYTVPHGKYKSCLNNTRRYKRITLLLFHTGVYYKNMRILLLVPISGKKPLFPVWICLTRYPAGRQSCYLQCWDENGERGHFIS